MCSYSAHTGATISSVHGQYSETAVGSALNILIWIELLSELFAALNKEFIAFHVLLIKYFKDFWLTNFDYLGIFLFPREKSSKVSIIMFSVSFTDQSVIRQYIFQVQRL